MSGDWNGDGKLDLAVTGGQPSNIGLWLGNGDGTFQPGGNVTVPPPLALATADWNGDGKADLVVTTLDPTDNVSVSVLLGNGNGTFGAPVNRVPNIEAGLVFGRDLNGDGKVDLVLGEGGLVAVALGNGDGTFQGATQYSAGSAYTVGSSALSVGDWNGDGRIDIATVVGGGGGSPLHGIASVLLGNGDGTFRQAANYYAGPDPSDAVLADWNGDGKPDLAVVSSSAGTIAVLAGNGDGTFQAARDYLTGVAPFDLVAGDWNGDGKADLVVTTLANNTGGVSVFLGDGQGNFTAGVGHVVADAVAAIGGDWNHDGKLDLALSVGSVLLGNGDGTFDAAATFSPAGNGITTGTGTASPILPPRRRRPLALPRA